MAIQFLLLSNTFLSLLFHFLSLSIHFFVIAISFFVLVNSFFVLVKSFFVTEANEGESRLQQYLLRPGTSKPGKIDFCPFTRIFP